MHTAGQRPFSSCTPVRVRVSLDWQQIRTVPTAPSALDVRCTRPASTRPWTKYNYQPPCHYIMLFQIVLLPRPENASRHISRWVLSCSCAHTVRSEVSFLLNTRSTLVDTWYLVHGTTPGSFYPWCRSVSDINSSINLQPAAAQVAGTGSY